MKKLIVDETNSSLRVDACVAKSLEMPRNQAIEMVKDGKILVNGNKVKPSYKTNVGDTITVEEVEPKELKLEAQDLDFEIVYEDDDVAIVNKPSGMVVHPAAGNEDNTLVNGLLYKMDIKSTINNVFRPGIVHRIDKDTSGLLMIAKNDEAMESLSLQLKNHSCNRRYIALVYGLIKEDEGRIEIPIGRDKIDRKKMAVDPEGKEAITNFKVLKRYKDFTLIECKLETGRTHQIRVHLKHIGHPLVGDKTYGPRKVIGNHGQFLHAKTIGFVHPRTKEYMEFTSELPEYFTDFLNELDK